MAERTAAQMEADAEDIPTDDEARSLIDSWSPEMSAYEKVKTDLRLGRYFQRQKEVERDAGNRHFRNLVLDPEARKDLVDSPGIVEATKMFDSDSAKNQVADAAIVNSYMEFLAGRPLTAIEKEAARHAWGKQLSGKPRTGVTEALSLMEKSFQTQDRVKELTGKMSALATRDYIEAALQGKAPSGINTLRGLGSRVSGLDHPEDAKRGLCAV